MNANGGFMKLNENLRRLREERQLTQETVAQALNVSRQAVSNWEQGKRYPDALMLVQISDYYEIPVDILLKSDLSYAKALVIKKDQLNTVIVIIAQILMIATMIFGNDSWWTIPIYMSCIVTVAYIEEIIDFFEKKVIIMKRK